VPKIQLSYQWSPDGADPSRPTSPLHHPLMALLQAVRDSGSISMAAKSLGVSYRHVWGELKRWEQLLVQPLIVWEKRPAGSPDGLCRQTALGRATGPGPSGSPDQRPAGRTGKDLCHGL